MNVFQTITSFLNTYITPLIDIFLAFIATWIAVIQRRQEKKKKEEERKKDTIIRDLSGKVSIIEYSSTEKRFFAYASKLSLMDIDRSADLSKMDKDITTLKDLYIGLLEFESEFSLSYGFGRYIDILRENLPQLQDLYDKANEQNKQGEYNQASKQIDSYYTQRNNLNPYIRELKYKFPDK